MVSHETAGWNVAHPNLMRKYARDWYHRHMKDPNFKENFAKKSRLDRIKRKRALFDILGYSCVKCGYSDMRALQIDHINGGGRKLTREHKSSDTLYKKLLAYPESIKKELQVLCANCNFIKRYESGEVKLSKEWHEILECLN